MLLWTIYFHEKVARDHLIAKLSIFHRRTALEELPLSPLEEVIHPQIQMSGAASAVRLEESYLSTSYKYFELGSYAIRNKDNVFSYQKLHEKFKGLGLLNDLHIDATTSADYVRLCLARAEQYRQSKGCAFYANVFIKDLPLGPLEVIEFKNDYALERIANGMHIDSTCVVCRTSIKPGQSVLFTCKCCIVQCRWCVTLSIGLHEDTYREEPVGIKCPICRLFSYSTVTNTQKAIDDENILVTQALQRLYPELKNPEGLLFCNSNNSGWGAFSNTKKSYRILNETLERMTCEALENGLYLVQTDITEQLHSAKDDQNLVRSGIARLEVAGLYQFRCLITCYTWDMWCLVLNCIDLRVTCLHVVCFMCSPMLPYLPYTSDVILCMQHNIMITSSNQKQ